jgi:hypothetical protein
MFTLEPPYRPFISFLVLAHGTVAEDASRANRATQDEVVTFVKRAVEYFKANGKEKALAEYNTQTSFWTHYKFTDPLTHKILPKSVYCEVVNDTNQDEMVICSGVYDAPNQP